MERRKKDDFDAWVLKMLEKYGVTRQRLGREIGMQSIYISDTLNGLFIFSKRTKYLINNFFEKEYNESYEPLKQRKSITFGEWLNEIMIKHEIENYMIAKKIGVKESSVHSLRKEMVPFERKQREEILNLLERDYGVDISDGRELLDKVENRYYKEIGEWMRNAMQTMGINNIELSQHVKISKSTVRLAVQGRIVLSDKSAEKIFAFFEENGIDTSKGREKFAEAVKYRKSTIS